MARDRVSPGLQADRPAGDADGDADSSARRGAERGPEVCVRGQQARRPRPARGHLLPRLRRHPGSPLRLPHPGEPPEGRALPRVRRRDSRRVEVSTDPIAAITPHRPGMWALSGCWHPGTMRIEVSIMVRTIKENVVIRSGSLIEIRRPDLPEGV